MITKIRYFDIQSYVTKDGSIIRELMHPDIHGNVSQSLAEAIVPIGGITIVHKHLKSEEIYHITQGHGVMFLNGEKVEVEIGDTIYIPIGAAHKIQNTGKEPMKILCCSCPAYSHGDTELLS
jgi:mannose-6-phosphate isomerase-like protein (cupin superfamily)